MSNEPSNLANYLFRLAQFGVIDSDDMLAACLRRMPEETIVRMVLDHDWLDPEHDEGDWEILDEACKRLNIST